MTDKKYQQNINALRETALLEADNSLFDETSSPENRRAPLSVPDPNATLVKKYPNNSLYTPASAWRRASGAIATIFKGHQRSSFNPKNDGQSVPDESDANNIPPQVVIQDPKNPGRDPRNPNRPQKINRDQRLPGIEDLDVTENPLSPGLIKTVPPVAFPVLIPVSLGEIKNMGSGSPVQASFTVSNSSKRSVIPKRSGGEKSTEEVIVKAGLERELKKLKNSQTKSDSVGREGSKITAATLFGYNSKLERGLRSISNKPPNAKTKLEPNKKMIPVGLVNAGGALAVGGTSKESNKDAKSNSLDDKSDKPLDPSSKSMRQLYSMADSWSTDSLRSHSESCPCCHNKEPCPIHGKTSGVEKNNNEPS